MNSSALQKLMAQVADFSMGRLALFGVILSAIYYVSFFNSGSSIQQSIVTLNTQIEEEKNKKVETTRILQKEEQMRADVTMLVKRYEDVKSKIPLEFLESELRSIIDKYATQFEIKTTKNLRATKAKDFGATQDSNLVDQVGLEYTFMGSYFNLEKFVEQIAITDKLVKVENFIVTAIEKQTKMGLSREIILTATIIGFKQSSTAIGENKSGGKK